MKYIVKSVLFLFAIIAVGYSFQSCKSAKPIDKTQLSGYWQLKTLLKQDAKSAFEGTLPSIEFDFDKKTVFGSGGCNRYNGGFTLNDKNEFTAATLASTMMACMQQNKESEFLATLSKPNLVVSIDKNGILTFTEGTNVVLEFEKGEAPKDPSEEISVSDIAGSWELSYMEGDDVSKLFIGKMATIEIDAEGKVFGNGGCNTYRGTYKLEKNIMTFGPLMSTKMACQNLDGEGKFMKFLSTPVKAKINGGRLVFLKDGSDVFLEFKKVVK